MCDSSSKEVNKLEKRQEFLQNSRPCVGVGVGVGVGIGYGDIGGIGIEGV